MMAVLTKRRCLIALVLILAGHLDIRLVLRSLSMSPWHHDHDSNNATNSTSFSAASHQSVASPQSMERGQPIKLILHVGPPKTATSSIQCTLVDVEKSGRLSKTLAAKVVEVQSCRPSHDKEAKMRLMKYKQQFNPTENITVEDTSDLATLPRVIKGGAFLPACISKWKDFDNTTLQYPDCWGDSYLKYMRAHYNTANYNTFIVSNEILAVTFGGFDEQTCQRVISDILSSLDVDGNSVIEIVYTQRMFFDYLLSMEFEGDKLLAKPRLGKWGGLHTPDLAAYVTERMKKDYEPLSKSIKCFRLASDSIPRVRFHMIDYNNDEGGDVLESFFQILTGGDEILASNLIDSAMQQQEKLVSSKPQSIPSDPSAMGRMRDEILTNLIISIGASSQQQSTKPQLQLRKNVASSKPQLIPSDRIALAAYDAGLVPLDKKMTRHQARMAVKDLLDTLSPTIQVKYKCPDNKVHQSLLELLELSVQLQQLAFPEREKDGVKGDVMESFQRVLDNNKLCDVDGHAMINDADFRPLLVKQFRKTKRYPNKILVKQNM